MAGIAAAVIGGVLSLGGAVFGASSANKRERRARREKNKLTGELNALEKRRQKVINPYDQVKDLSSMVSDLSGIASNPFSNLAVSTASAEIQIEEADIALANTLDILRATGASAGGATALARMALESKKGVSASIEKQEAQNQQLRAQGEERLQDVELSEARRVQSTLITEADYQRQAGVQGRIYEFETNERRQKEQLNRKQSQITGAAMQEGAAIEAKGSAIASGISAFGNVAGAYASAKANGAQ